MRRGDCGLQCWRQAWHPSVLRMRSLAGSGLPFVSWAFLSLSSRQEEFWCGQRIGELQGGRSLRESLFFFLVINNAFVLLWLCSRHGEISPCLRGQGKQQSCWAGIATCQFPALPWTRHPSWLWWLRILNPSCQPLRKKLDVTFASLVLLHPPLAPLSQMSLKK